MPTIPTPGQKNIPIKDWNRFLRVADWWDQTFGHKQPGVLGPTYGQDMIVKTPEGGIDARDDTSLFSATCIRCVEAEASTPGEMVIHETGEEVVVYNFYPLAVTGDIYAITSLTASGTRYVSGEPCPD